MELLGMQGFTGFAAFLRGRAAALISEGGFLDAARGLLATAPMVHADDTFACAAGATAFVHVACTEHVTVMHTGNRSATAIDAGAVLTELGAGQVLVRDGYPDYTTSPTCNTLGAARNSMATYLASTKATHRPAVGPGSGRHPSDAHRSPPPPVLKAVRA